jgi:hypothetical protein
MHNLEFPIATMFFPIKAPKLFVYDKV